ncbi:MAG: hypothetical protein KAI57_01915 [Candidatus Pacebacteria bacterium]|nr:hypothetical protein [Candidatus Paceibacterota bacterium]
MTKNFNKIDQELDENPVAILIYYTLIFGIIWYFIGIKSIPFLFAVCLYEIKKMIIIAKK